MEININGVKITLTDDQLAEIARQTRKQRTVNDINSYEDACEVLQRAPNYTLKSINGRYFAQHVLETIIEAVNFIDNDFKKWIPNFNDSTYKYLPYFNRVGSSWSVYVVVGSYAVVSCPVSLYYKEKNTVNIITKKFLNTYNIYLG